jgi:hypothetical protein
MERAPVLLTLNRFVPLIATDEQMPQRLFRSLQFNKYILPPRVMVQRGRSPDLRFNLLVGYGYN